MRYLLSWVQDFMPQPLPGMERIVEALEQMGLSVAGCRREQTGFQGVKVGEILEVWKHPNADRLRLARVTDGAGEFQVVCGAPNLANRQKVAFAPIGSSLSPEGNGRLIIEPRQIREMESQGMICSARELGLGKEHDGILVLPNDWTIGRALADYISQETVLDVEIPLNRWDLLSHAGIARDLANYFWRVPSKERPLLPHPPAKETIEITVASGCGWALRRYMATALSGLKPGASPWWISRRLGLLGIASVNNIVDVTNYVALEMGQPLHAFDRNKLEGGQIQVRWAKPEERFEALNGALYNLAGSDLVIADSLQPVALAGVIGGNTAKVGLESTDILLECAWFDRRAVRATSRRLGVLTESSLRFEKETDIHRLPDAIQRAVELLTATAGGSVRAYADYYPSPQQPRRFEFSTAGIGKILGFPVGQEELLELLSPLCEETEKLDSEHWLVTPRSGRMDLTCEEDLAEEALRYLGSDVIPGLAQYNAHIPAVTAPLNEPHAQRRREISGYLRKVFQGWGFSEAVNLPLIPAHEAAELLGPQAAETLVETEKSVSSELGWLRPSLLPGLYKNWLFNQNRSKKPVFLQEIGVVHKAGRIPGEPFSSRWFWAAIACGPRRPAHWSRKDFPSFDFWDMTGMVEGAFKAMGLAARRGAPSVLWPVAQPDRHIEWTTTEDNYLGRHFQIMTQEAMDKRVEFPVLYAEIDLEAFSLAACAVPAPHYQDPGAIGAIYRDLAIVVDIGTSWERIEGAVRGALGPLAAEMVPFDIFTGPKFGPDKKSVALRVCLTPRNHTPTQEEINGWMNNAIHALNKAVGAELRDK